MTPTKHIITTMDGRTFTTRELIDRNQGVVVDFYGDEILVPYDEIKSIRRARDWHVKPTPKEV